MLVPLTRNELKALRLSIQMLIDVLPMLEDGGEIEDRAKTEALLKEDLTTIDKKLAAAIEIDDEKLARKAERQK